MFKTLMLSLELKTEELGSLISWEIDTKINAEKILIYAHLFTLQEEGFHMFPQFDRYEIQK